MTRKDREKVMGKIATLAREVLDADREERLDVIHTPDGIIIDWLDSHMEVLDSYTFLNE